ncbi:unnamed protein product, partial [Polarella glacialis]
MVLADDNAAVSKDYSAAMQKKMGTALTYVHEDGMNYAWVTPQLIVGGCPQTAADIDRLVAEGVGVVLCLQEDKDMKHFDLDIEPIQGRCSEVGISHLREPISDFDPFDLRKGLARAVRRLVKEMASQPGKLAYIHCTAGLGRAPAVALAYMFWIDGMCLDEAYKQLLAVRMCHPQIGAIRSATWDLLQ